MNIKNILNFRREDSEENKLWDFWYFLKTRRPKKSVVILTAVLIAVIAGIFIVFNHVDENYDVLSTMENEDT